jgi:hypothetical protein
MGRMKAALGLRLDLALRGVALREEALRRAGLRLADFLPLAAFFFLPALRAPLRAGAMRALRLDAFFFFLAAFFFFAGFFLAFAIVISFEFEGFVRWFVFFFFVQLSN